MTLFAHPSWLPALIGPQQSNDAFTDTETQKWKRSLYLCKDWGGGAFLLMRWQRQRSGLIPSSFTGTNVSKWTHRWLVYMLLICFQMQPSIFYNWFMTDCGICLSAFVCVCVGISWKLSTVGRRRELCILKMTILCAKPSNKCDITHCWCNPFLLRRLLKNSKYNSSCSVTTREYSLVPSRWKKIISF